MTSITTTRRRYTTALVAIATVALLTVATGTAAAAPPSFSWPPTGHEDFGRYSVGSCGGAGPVACVSAGDRQVGSVEHFAAPTATFDILHGVENPTVGIRRIARDFIKGFRADRTTTCPELRFRPIGPEPATVAGDPGLRWGFELLKEGRVVERTLDYGIIRDDTLHILVANAATNGACTPSEGSFTVRGLERFDRQYRRLAAGSDFTT